MKTLGYLEVKGLTNAIVSADKMLKTADVELKNISNTRGSGWVTVAIIGDVAAVSVAITMAKEMMGENYVSSTVLANPAEGIEKLNRTDLLLKPTERKRKVANTEPADAETQQPMEKLEPQKSEKSTSKAKAKKESNNKKESNSSTKKHKKQSKK